MKVFYTEKQNVENNDSYSPSAGKPKKVLKNWQDLGFNVELIEPSPVTREDFYRAHSSGYVDGVLDLKKFNGFGNKNPDVAKSLYWTSGSFVSAAMHAVNTGESVVSLTSGFHHARYASGGGFCTFNGLMVAFQKLRSLGYSGKIGVLDCDAHYGDGTDDIIDQLGLTNIEHYTFGAYGIYPDNSDEWINKDFPRVLKNFSNCGVIFYQAGADPHVNDPLGGHLTTEQMLMRDALVFNFAKANNIPVAWNLAGGYQKDFNRVLELHANTARVHIDVFKSSNLQKINLKIS